MMDIKIISASRRTDIPAFYGDWFMNRINEGFAGYSNPFNNKKNIVSLKKEDTAAIVLWSKNFSPFISNALKLRDRGYSLFFNYTITGLPGIFEPAAPAEHEAIESMKLLSSEFSPEHINWRYDPILLSDITRSDYHLNKFEDLSRSLSGYVKRCYISFPSPYGKVQRSFKNFTDRTGITIITENIHSRVVLAEKLSSIAENYGIGIFSCCGDYLTGGKISKGSCIDGTIISSISGKDLSHLKLRPTRKECGCADSTDIGVYDSCPHGCIYCYANSNADRAATFHKRYMSDSGFQNSAFPGVSKDISDIWIEKIKENRNNSDKDDPAQPLLF
jgi:hypothetical protein